MKYLRFLSLVLVCSMITSFGFSQGIDFYKGSWAEALEKAKEEQKIIFVDAYATWCGPCKRMAKTVFTDKAVGEFYNAHFINMKLDMERGDGLQFRSTFSVTAYPTLFFIDWNGKLIQKIKGAKPVDAFLELGNHIISKYDESGNFAEEYEKGNRDPKLVLDYIMALNKAGKKSVRIANDYIKTQDDLTTNFNLNFILNAVSEADSRMFGLLIKHEQAIKNQNSQQAFDEAVERACNCTAKKAAEYQSIDLLKEAKENMEKYCPDKAPKFAITSEMKYYKSIGDSDNYLKASGAFAKKVLKNDANGLHNLAIEIASDLHTDKKAMKQAEKYAKKATKLEPTEKYYLTYASILNTNGKTADAMEVAKKCLQLSEKEGKPNKNAKILIKQLEEKS